MVPGEIDILIHHHTCGECYPWKSGFYSETIANFIENGILKYEGERLRTTPKCEALVEMLCRTPYPEEAYIDPRSREVIKP